MVEAEGGSEQDDVSFLRTVSKLFKLICIHANIYYNLIIFYL